MRLKNDEYILLKNVLAVVESHTGRGDLAAGLKNLLARFEKAREERRERNREQWHERKKKDG